MKIQSSIDYPFIAKLVTRGWFQVGFIVVTLFLAVYYNVAYYWYTPVTGVDWNYLDDARSAFQITQVLPGSPGEAGGLQVGDRLLFIDGQAIDTYNRPLYTPKNAGDIVQYTVEREGHQRTFKVIAGDYSQHPEYLLPMLSLGLLSLLVYALGLLLCLLSAPEDTRARLVGAGWLLVGLALAAGGLGYVNGGWFVVDVYLATLAAGGYLALAAHLYFPAASFSNRARLLTLRAHLGLTLLALAAYAWQRISAGEAAPPEALASGALIKYIFYLTWLVNVFLLLKNGIAAQETDTKRQAQIILFGTLLGVLPVLVLSALPGVMFGLRFMFLPGQVSALTLVCIPLSYSYAIGQHKLLKIDRLVNRALVLFALAILILVASMVILGIIAVSLHWSAQIALLGGILCALAALLLTVGLHRRIQVGVDRALYDASYDFRSSTACLAGQLAKISDRQALDELLKVEFAKQLHIQESKLLLAQDGRLALPQGAACDVADDDVCQFLLEEHLPARAKNVWAAASPETAERWAAFRWGRVFAPIAYNGTLHGVWILGDRLNGDYYSRQDMENIHTVSLLVALALANLAAVEALHGLSQRMVETEEEQRRSVARELHDDTLQRVFHIRRQLAASQYEDAEAQLQELAQSVGQIIKAQRPSFLAQDIAMALQGLVYIMRPPAGAETSLRLEDLLPEPINLGDERTTAIYRIAQESLSNVHKHAQAKEAVVTLKMDGELLEIEIKDDGIGMEDTQREPPGHYGLMGMRERAAMIGATLAVASVVGEGTSVRVRLKP